MCNQEPTCHVCGMLLADGQLCPKCSRHPCAQCITDEAHTIAPAVTTSGLCAAHAGTTYAIRVSAAEEVDAEGKPYTYMVGTDLQEEGMAFASVAEAEAALAGLPPDNDEVCIVCAKGDVMQCIPDNAAGEVTVVQRYAWRLQKI